MTWIAASRTRLALVSICATVLVITLIALIITWAPGWLASTHGLAGKDRVEEIGRVRTALLAALAGALATVGAVYTARSFALSRQGHELNRQGQITERFTRAVDQLGNAQVDVRLGGIYALERIARESREDHGPIIEILTAYVREHASWPFADDASSITAAEQNASAEEQETTFGLDRAVGRLLRTFRSSESDKAGGSRSEPSTDTQDVVAEGVAVLAARLREQLQSASKRKARAMRRGPGTDVQGVLTVLGRRTRDSVTDLPVDLRHTYLPEANLTGNLEEVLLDGANLQTAHLAGDLRGASMIGADLRGAMVGDGANLSGADLSETKLQGADLSGAYLVGALLEDADLDGANFKSANLSGAKLARAIFGDANAAEADMRKAYLWEANLSLARLYRANLEGAYLAAANLTLAHLRSANLCEAFLYRADLTGAHLADADLRRADLRHAKLPEANLVGTKLEGATYSQATVWPDGFDPDALGAVLESEE